MVDNYSDEEILGLEDYSDEKLLDFEELKEGTLNPSTPCEVEEWDCKEELQLYLYKNICFH